MENYSLRKGLVAGLLSLGMVISFTSLDYAQEREELLFEEIPIVVSATKREESIYSVPVAVSVITREQIEKSGAINIPQLLRRIAGVDVSYDSASQYDVSIRGFNHSLSPTILVMIDGLSVYQDFYGMVTWDWLPITMDDIERIEVVKSPISCLYGANAFFGVINIITKTPKQAKGTRLSTTFGEDKTYVNSLLGGFEKGNLATRISYGFNETNEWNQSSGRNVRSQRVNNLIQYNLKQDSAISLNSSAVFNGKGLVVNGLWQRDLNYLAYETLAYKSPEWEFQTYWRGANIDIFADSTPYDLDYNVLGIRLQNTLSITKNNTLISGVEYKQTKLEGGQGTLTDADHTRPEYSGYFQNEYKPVDSISLLVGMRVDDQPLIDTQFSPRVSMIYFLDKDHNIHLSFNRAFRSPSLYSNYYYQVFYPPAYGGLSLEFVGNRDLKPEEVMLYEIGYRGRLNNLELTLDLFHKKLKDYIFFSPKEYYFPGVPSKYTWLNKEKAVLEGGEIEFKYPFTDWAKGYFNYSYQGLVYYKEDLTQLNAPKHKLNTGIETSFKNGFFATLNLHHCGNYSWEESVGVKKGKPYTLTDLSLGYQFPRPDAKILLSIFNLFDEVHREQLAIWADLDGSYTGRQVILSLRLNW